MTQKYPQNNVPYRYVRQQQGSCCYAHDSTAKRSFPSRTAAKEKARKFGGQEPYSCEVHEGRWHLRRRRN